MKPVIRLGLALGMATSVGVLPACAPEDSSSAVPQADGPIVKGGDDRTGEYDPVEGWWKPAPG